MNWSDFLLKALKAVAPKINIKLDFRKTDNRKIIITGENIKIGDQLIKDKKVIDNFYNELEKYKKRDTLPLPVVHKDIVDDYLEYEQISIQEKESLKKLRKILNSTEIECVLMARRAFLASKRKDKKLFDELIGQLEKNCPENGKKLFNLMSTGYFDELILPFMDVMKSRHGEEKYVEEYNKFYRSLMKFFPTAVFVGNYTNQEKLKHEITKRLKLSNIPFIKLHAIGENNIVKVGKIVEELKIEKHYEVDDNRFSTPLGLKAQIYEIRIKKE